MTWPSTPGVPVCTGTPCTAWGTTLVVAQAATASAIAQRNSSGEVIAANTVGTGKTPMAADTLIPRTHLYNSVGNTLIVVGDSISSGAATATGWTAVWEYPLSILSGGSIVITDNAAVGGASCASLASSIATTVAKAPSKVVILCGTVDTGGGVSPATTVAGITTMVTALRAANIEPILATIPPRDTTFHPQIRATNSAITTYALAQGIKLIDFYSALVDPATGNYISGYGADGVHPTSLGSKVMALTALRTVLSSFPDTAAPYLPIEDADGFNLVTDPLMDTGTSGTDSAGSGSGNVGDTVPTGWTYYGSGTGVLTVATDPAISGKWATITAAASGASNILTEHFTTGFTVGDTLAFSGRVKSSVEAAGTSTYSIFMNFNPSIATYTIAGGLSVDLDGAWYLTGPVPTGTTSIDIYMSISGGTGSLSVGQIGLANLTANNPGLITRTGSFHGVAIEGSYSNPGFIRTLDGSKLVGLIPTAVLPVPTTTTFGGVKDLAAVSNSYLTSVVNGVPVTARPTCANLSDSNTGCSTAAYVLPSKNATVKVGSYEVGSENTAAAFATADLTSHAFIINDANAKTLVEASCISDAGSQTITVKISSTTLFSITCVAPGTYSASTTNGTTGYIIAASMGSTAVAAHTQLDLSGTANTTSKDVKLQIYGTVN